MGLVIGIDVGGSTTKIIGLDSGNVQSPMYITSTDPITSLFGAFGKYVYDNHISLTDIEHVMLTGVGASGVTTPIYGLPTSRAAEFDCDGLGAKFAVDIDPLMVVSMGTGTTLVQVKGDVISHAGGISMGGGTLQGLSRLLLNVRNIPNLVAMAAKGDASKVNLQIQDISKEVLEGLPMHATASLFGKAVNNQVSDEDIAKGIIMMVIETIGSAAVLSTLNSGIKDFCMIGNLTRMEECREVFSVMEDLYNVRFHIPEHAVFLTALGAALAYDKGKYQPL